MSVPLMPDAAEFTLGTSGTLVLRAGRLMPDSADDNLPTMQASRLRTRARVLVTLADQGIVSVATYLTGVLISRSTQGGFGLYILVFTLWVFGGEALNSLISTPQMLRLPRLSPRRARLFNGSLLLHAMMLSGVLIALMIAASGITYAAFHNSESDEQRNIPLVLLMAAASIGPITLRNFGRNFCFATRDSVSAFALDACASVIQLGGVAMLFAYKELQNHWWLAVVVVGMANLLSGLMWLAMARPKIKPQFGRAMIDLRRNWRTSRPIFASSMLWIAGMYTYPWLIHSIAGEHQAGVWAACFTLANLGNPLILGIQNFMGPAIAHAHADRDAHSFRNYVLRCTVIYLVIVLPACLAMAILAEPLLRHINGGNYAGYGHVTAILAFSMLMQGISFPTSRGLFSLKRADLDMYANVGPLVVLAAAAWLMISWKGVVGAAICLIVAQFIGSLARGSAFLLVSGKGGGIDLRVTPGIVSPTAAPPTSEVAA